MPRLLFLPLALLAGCAPPTAPAPAPPPDPGPPPPAWTADMQTAADGHNRFALDLFAQLRREPGNLFCSGYSAHAALAMTATGARGNTRDEMAKVLHLPNDPLAVGDLGRYYAHPRPAFTLTTANRLYGQAGFPWRPEFLDPVKERFAAGFQDADFKKDADAERLKINTWAEEQTRGKVKDLIGEGKVNVDTRLVLVNAIYFKGAWEKQFDPKLTRPMPFTLADGSTVRVPTMERKGGFRLYAEVGKGSDRWTPEFQVAELPYKGGELAMVILLPGKHDGLPALEAKLTPDALAGWLAKTRDADTAELYLPKFRIETKSMDLVQPLKALGMKDAFDRGRADLSGMHSGGGPLFVSFVVQKAFVDVNEEGTEAAAATAVGAEKTSAPPEFRADRPFLFLIRDTTRGTILFAGRVAKP